MKTKKPNVILIYADDLGMGILGCYGQKKFATPHIDQLAANGMRFTRAYATAFCAPARASLLMGIHDAHAGRWTYNAGGLHKKVADGQITDEFASEVIMNSGMVSNTDQKYLPQVFKEAGYVTAEIGKLEWGFNTCGEEMDAHGWDYHYGYYDHVACHGFYPPFVHENGKKVWIEGNTHANFGVLKYGHLSDEAAGDFKNARNLDMTGRAVHSQDLFDTQISEFIDNNKEQPFFLYHPSQLPHGPVIYPDIHPSVKDRDDLIAIEKEYVSMVLRLDETVGKIVKQLDSLGLTEKTMIIFASDNGHTANDYEWPGRTQVRSDLEGREISQWDNPFRTETFGDTFDGNSGLAGLKFSNWDGGARVPYIFSMPGTIDKNTICDELISAYDLFATSCTITGSELPSDKDGVSYESLLLGRKEFKGHEYVVFGSPIGPGLVTKDGWKVRAFSPNLGDQAKWQLYNVEDDPAEKIELSEKFPEKLRELVKILRKECDGNEINGQSGAHNAFYTDIEVPKWDEVIKGII